MATRAHLRVIGGGTAEQRRAKRHRVVLRCVTARELTGHAGEAMLLDVSLYGCRLESQLAHLPGERVWLKLLGDKAVPARVIWAERGVAGCRFESSITSVQLRALLSDR